MNQNPYPQQPQPAPPAARNRGAAQAPSAWLATGSTIEQLEASQAAKAAASAEKRKAGIFGDGPYRFFLKPGEEANVVILDVSFNSAAAIHEHNIRGADGKWGTIEP